MRRPKGEGSVTKLSTGKYRARIELDPMNGKRKWLSVIRDTAPEARKALRELLRKKEVLEVQQKYNDLFPAVVADFLESCQTKQLRYTTMKRYEGALRLWSEAFAYKKVSKITTKDIDNEIRCLQQRGFKTGTIRLSVIILGNVFNYLIRHKKVTANPVTLCAIPKKVRTKRDLEIINKKEHHKLLKYLRPFYDDFLATGDRTIKARMYAIYLTVYSTGIREGELAGLTWKALNKTSNTISINQQVIFVKGKYVVSPPKTEASYRDIAVSDKFMCLLNEIENTYNKFNYKTPFIFGNLYKDGEPTGPRLIGQTFQSYLKKAGITRPFTFHDLRHTHATHLLEQGIPINTVSSRLGHSYASTTLDIYGHILKQTSDKVIALCEDF